LSKTGFLLIADISGYTEFVKLHNIRKKPILGNVIANNFQSHAETIISDLLESVIDSIEPKMKLNKLEGDAAFFFCEKNNSKYESDKIIEVMDKANEAFKKKASELVFVQVCGCEPCMQSKNLKLKIVAHQGNFSIQQIRNFEELAGEDVILTHRMLKNDLLSNEYWLITDSFFQGLSNNQQKRFTKISQDLENFGKTNLNYIEFSSPEPRNKKLESRSKIFNWFAQAAYFMTFKRRSIKNSN